MGQRPLEAPEVPYRPRGPPRPPIHTRCHRGVPSRRAERRGASGGGGAGPGAGAATRPPDCCSDSCTRAHVATTTTHRRTDTDGQKTGRREGEKERRREGGKGTSFKLLFLSHFETKRKRERTSPLRDPLSLSRRRYFTVAIPYVATSP